jgi:hypothetical protein
MAQFSTSVRNGRAAVLPSLLGPSPRMCFYSAAAPAHCEDADPAGLLVSMSLPTVAFTAPAGGKTSLSGVWSGLASATGLAASYRIKDAAGTFCGEQGSIISALDLANGIPGDLVVDNPRVISGDTILFAKFDQTDGDA